jgi:hypothetical protein
MKITKYEIIKAALVLVIAPIAVVWDLLFFIVKSLCIWMTYIDEAGAEIIESLLDKE